MWAPKLFDCMKMLDIGLARFRMRINGSVPADTATQVAFLTGGLFKTGVIVVAPEIAQIIRWADIGGGLGKQGRSLQ